MSVQNLSVLVDAGALVLLSCEDRRCFGFWTLHDTIKQSPALCDYAVLRGIDLGENVGGATRHREKKRTSASVQPRNYFRLSRNHRKPTSCWCYVFFRVSRAPLYYKWCPRLAGRVQKNCAKKRSTFGRERRESPTSCKAALPTYFWLDHIVLGQPFPHPLFPPRKRQNTR